MTFADDKTQVFRDIPANELKIVRSVTPAHLRYYRMIGVVLDVVEPIAHVLVYGWYGTVERSRWKGWALVRRREMPDNLRLY